jgi:hypothetical protein
MHDAAEMAERHGRILARLAELGLAQAERLNAQALAAEDPKTAADLGLAFHRVARTVRQSIALEARLVRDLQAAERRERDARDDLRSFRDEIPDPFADMPRDQRRIDARKEAIRATVQQAIWDEVEPEDAEHAGYLEDLLEQRLDLFGRSNGFGLEPLEEHLARFYADFSLRGPEPGQDADDDGAEDFEFDAAPLLEDGRGPTPAEAEPD